MSVQQLRLDNFPRPETARALSPNGRVHWSVKYQHRSEVHDFVAVMARSQGLRRTIGHVTIAPHFVFPEPRRRDDDNLATGVIKHVRDALVRGGYLADDDVSHVQQLPVQVTIERGKRALILAIKDDAP